VFFFLEAGNREAMDLVLRERGNTRIGISQHAEIPNSDGWEVGSGYNQVEKKMVVWTIEDHYQLGAVTKADSNFFTSDNF